MVPAYKETRVQIEAPIAEPFPIPLGEAKRPSGFYYVVILLTLVCSGISVYLSFSA